jgi:hypothetical protein
MALMLAIGGAILVAGVSLLARATARVEDNDR